MIYVIQVNCCVRFLVMELDVVWYFLKRTSLHLPSI